MSHLAKGNYLRVLVPVTVDGINLAYENGKPKLKEVHLPPTALRSLQKKNDRLPNQLKMQIDLIDNTIAQRPLPPTEETVTLTKAQLEKLMSKIKADPEQPTGSDTKASAEKKAAATEKAKEPVK